MAPNNNSDYKNLILEGGCWKTKDEVYNAFFSAVGAPAWHGRNFNALRDSIKGGGINKLEVPYAIQIKGIDAMSEEAKKMTLDFIGLIHELKAEGVPVDAAITAR